MSVVIDVELDFIGIFKLGLLFVGSNYQKITRRSCGIAIGFCFAASIYYGGIARLFSTIWSEWTILVYCAAFFVNRYTWSLTRTIITIFNETRQNLLIFVFIMILLATMWFVWNAFFKPFTVCELVDKCDDALWWYRRMLLLHVVGESIAHTITLALFELILLIFPSLTIIGLNTLPHFHDMPSEQRANGGMPIADIRMNSCVRSYNVLPRKVRAAQQECCICCVDFVRENNILGLQCGHFFHEDCALEQLARYEGNKCPFCRQSISSAIDEKSQKKATKAMNWMRSQMRLDRNKN